MTILNILRIVLLSLYWNLPSTKRDFLVPGISVSREINRKRERRKVLRKRQRPLIPQKIKRSKFHHQYRSSKPRDHRFSDQQKLRRMYRNC